jgi:hypothetical protein
MRRISQRSRRVHVKITAELGPHWVRAATVEHGHHRSPGVTDGPEDPHFGGPLAHAATMMNASDSDRGPEGPGGRRRGSRRAATGVRNDRGARPKTVEDHDRQSCHPRPLTWRLSRVIPGPQHNAIPCRNARYRSRTEEARGSNPLTSTPNTAGQSVVSVERAALTACWGRAGAANAPGRVFDVGWERLPSWSTVRATLRLTG